MIKSTSPTKTRASCRCGGGLEQAYNAQAAVDAATVLVVGTGLAQAPNDKEQIIPILATLRAQPQASGKVTHRVADTGLANGSNILACEGENIEPLIAQGREAHHPDWRERHSEPPVLPDNATPAQAMTHRLKTRAGRALYA